MPNEDIVVRYVLELPWKLKPEILEIKDKLSKIPYLELISDGTSLIYRNNGPLTSTIIFSINGIKLCLYSNDIDSENKRKSIIYLLSVLVTTDYISKIDLSKLYTEVIDCLSNIRELKESASRDEVYKDRINAMNKANLGLYYKLQILNRKHCSLDSEVRVYKEICYKTISKFASSKDEITDYLNQIIKIPEPTLKKFIDDYIIWCKNDTK